MSSGLQDDHRLGREQADLGAAEARHVGADVGRDRRSPTSSAAAAFASREPSMWKSIPCAWACSASARSSSSE